MPPKAARRMSEDGDGSLFQRSTQHQANKKSRNEKQTLSKKSPSDEGKKRQKNILWETVGNRRLLQRPHRVSVVGLHRRFDVWRGLLLARALSCQAKNRPLFSRFVSKTAAKPRCCCGLFRDVGVT